MAGFRVVFDLSFFIFSVYLIKCSHTEDTLRVKEVIQEHEIDNAATSKTSEVYVSNRTDIRSELIDVARKGIYGIAGGMVSIDCLRCLCLKQSDCLPIGCVLRNGALSCGYFFLAYPYWVDCGKLGKDWRSCSNNLACSSQCVQNYMKRYAEKSNCFLKCEGYSRELYGGPNGCNNPHTLAFWEAVQKVPGCKGVE